MSICSRICLPCRPTIIYKAESTHWAFNFKLKPTMAPEAAMVCPMCDMHCHKVLHNFTDIDHSSRHNNKPLAVGIAVYLKKTSQKKVEDF